MAEDHVEASKKALEYSGAFGSTAPSSEPMRYAVVAVAHVLLDIAQTLRHVARHLAMRDIIDNKETPRG